MREVSHVLITTPKEREAIRIQEQTDNEDTKETNARYNLKHVGRGDKQRAWLGPTNTSKFQYLTPCILFKDKQKCKKTMCDFKCTRTTKLFGIQAQWYQTRYSVSISEL